VLRRMAAGGGPAGWRAPCFATYRLAFAAASFR